MRALPLLLLVALPAFACGPAVPDGLAGWVFIAMLLGLSVMASPYFWAVVFVLVVSFAVVVTLRGGERRREVRGVR